MLIDFESAHTHITWNSYATADTATFPIGRNKSASRKRARKERKKRIYAEMNKRRKVRRSFRSVCCVCMSANEFPCFSGSFFPRSSTISYALWPCGPMDCCAALPFHSTHSEKIYCVSEKRDSTINRIAKYKFNYTVFKMLRHFDTDTPRCTYTIMLWKFEERKKTNARSVCRIPNDGGRKYGWKMDKGQVKSFYSLTRTHTDSIIFIGIISLCEDFLFFLLLSKTKRALNTFKKISTVLLLLLLLLCILDYCTYNGFSHVQNCFEHCDDGG